MSEDLRRSSLRDELADVGFVPFASRLYRPSPGLVTRARAVGRVQAQAGEVVVVTAPAGYGKSTFAAELLAKDSRPAAWVSLTAAENDPAMLLSYVALALEAIEPVDPACVLALWGRTPSIGSQPLQAFAAMFATRRQAFTLVLDDFHELESRDALDAVAVMLRELPAGARVVLVSRRSIPLPLGRIRGRGRLVEVGAADLAFDEHEAQTLFAQLDVGMAAPAVAGLVARTEGWPVALYLAALADRAGHADASHVVSAFSGDHRYLVDYLGEELFADLDPDIASFLLDSSVLPRLSGSLCDDVLQRSGSAALLERLRGESLLVIPLDERQQWYRLHHLLAEFLKAELERRDPRRRVEIDRRASEWFDAHGDADAAITHAIRSGDHSQAEQLVMRSFGGLAAAGRSGTVDRWLELFPADELASRPGLMVIAAHGRFRDGQGGTALQWLDRAVAALPDLHPADARGPVAAVQLAAARAIIAPLTPTEMAAEARYTYDHVGLGEGHPLACLGLGAAAFMLGDDEEAARRFRECIDSPLDRPLPKASALAHLAVIEIEHGRWREATQMARQAKDVLGPTSIRRPPGVLVLASNVLVETYADRANDVTADRARCVQSLIDLVGVAPWVNAQARVALVREALIRGDRVAAARLLDEVETLAVTADAPGVLRQVANLQGSLRQGARDRTARFGPTSLTTAELRVLQLLPTHLSYVEIGERLYLSRHTVKTQALSMYRKLGTTSRSGAIDLAIEAGLLPPSPALP